jgi:DMSO/TMAO reductase YedYZ molybdopterin-dependent catalytic subunit
MKIFFRILIVLVIIPAILGFIFLFIMNGSIKLVDKEIHQYQGQNLSSINDFRENSIKGPQYINKEDYKLEISGLIKKPTFYSYDQVINNFKSYQKVTTLHCVEGWDVKILWQGILIKDLIKEVQPKPAAKVIIFYAVDGYSTSFPIEYFKNNDILMAYKMNDLFLPPERGFPFQLVAEDKWGYKWIKWITKMEFSNDVNYQGYWESRGYSKEGDLNKDFLK